MTDTRLVLLDVQARLVAPHVEAPTFATPDEIRDKVLAEVERVLREAFEDDLHAGHTLAVTATVHPHA